MVKLSYLHTPKEFLWRVSQGIDILIYEFLIENYFLELLRYSFIFQVYISITSESPIADNKISALIISELFDRTNLGVIKEYHQSSPQSPLTLYNEI